MERGGVAICKFTKKKKKKKNADQVTLTTSLAGAEGRGDPQVGGARVKDDGEVLRWAADGDGAVVGQLEEA